VNAESNSFKSFDSLEPLVNVVHSENYLTFASTTGENPVASDDVTKYAILFIVGLLLLIKVAPLVLEYVFYAIQVLRLRRFKRAWSQRANHITDKQVASSAALEFYTTFNSNRSKLLIIDFL